MNGPRTPAAALGVLVDGAPLPEPEARAFWERFSAWMEEHKGDLLGFAKAEGFSSVHPGIDAGRPVLRASRTAPQDVYAPVRGDAPDKTPSASARAPGRGSSSGSSPSHGGGSGSRQTARSGQRNDRPKSPGKSK